VSAPLVDPRPVSLSELVQLAPPPSQDPATAAQSILDAAVAEADALRARAVAEGLAEGMRLGRADAAAELAPAAAALAAAVQQAVAMRDEIVQAAEARAAELAIAIAERIVAAALGARPDLVVNVVRGALRGVLEGERIVICVHPDDVALVAGADLAAAEQHIEIYPERRVARGGALVRTSVGEIDARVATKLDAVRDIIAAELTDPRGAGGVP
jgi:flagellar assembly protein FliH